jgi:hypothetical protein
VLGGLAEFERHLIVARISGGRKRATGRGVLFAARANVHALLRVSRRFSGIACHSCGVHCDASGRSGSARRRSN